MSSANNVSAQEQADVKRIGTIYAEIEKNLNNPAYANKVTDEIYKYQPFILSVLLGYKMDFQLEELAPLVKLYLLIWLFYRDQRSVKNIPITPDRYMIAEESTVRMLQKIETAKTEKQKDEILNKDLNSTSSKALLAMIFLQFRENIILEKLNKKTQGAIIVGIRSFILCFDEIITKRWP